MQGKNEAIQKGFDFVGYKLCIYKSQALQVNMII